FDTFAENPDIAIRNTHQSDHHSDRCGLSRSIRPDKAEYFTFMYSKIQAFDDFPGSDLFPEITKFHCCFRQTDPSSLSFPASTRITEIYFTKNWCMKNKNDPDLMPMPESFFSHRPDFHIFAEMLTHHLSRIRLCACRHFLYSLSIVLFNCNDEAFCPASQISHSFS